MLDFLEMQTLLLSLVATHMDQWHCVALHSLLSERSVLAKCRTQSGPHVSGRSTSRPGPLYTSRVSFPHGLGRQLVTSKILAAHVLWRLWDNVT